MVRGPGARHIIVRGWRALHIIVRGRRVQHIIVRGPRGTARHCARGPEGATHIIVRERDLGSTFDAQKSIFAFTNVKPFAPPLAAQLLIGSASTQSLTSQPCWLITLTWVHVSCSAVRLSPVTLATPRAAHTRTQQHGHATTRHGCDSVPTRAYDVFGR
jgi:hypothetical protein